MAGADSKDKGTVENIRVAVRLRPFTQRERQGQAKRIVDMEQNTVALYHPRGLSQVKKFTFDYSYWSHDGFKRDSNGLHVPDPSHPNYDRYVDQDKVFQDLGKFLLQNSLKGYNSALLAYGQTGSGKSYTVSGYGQNEGILPRFARELFDELETALRQRKNSIISIKKDIKSGAVPKGRLEDTPSSATGTAKPGTPDPRQKQMNKDDSRFFDNGSQLYKYEIYFSMLEIYNEVVRDLLAKSHGHTVPATVPRRGLKVREHPRHGFFAEGLTSIRCHDRKEIETRIEEGQLNKSIAATSMNETSSRGHTIYKFTIKQIRMESANTKETMTTSVVQLVDLAGSERTSILTSSSPLSMSASSSPAPSFNHHPSSSSGGGSGGMNSQTSKNKSSQRFRESISINQSLSALGNCIQILSQNSQLTHQNNHNHNNNNNNQSDSSSISGHNSLSIKRQKVPYRDSVLTKLLYSCCLNGTSKTVIIATLSPADINYDDTLSTLRFADRAKQIRTHAKINEIDQAHVVHSLRKENERLKEIVDRRSHRSDDSSQTSNFDESENVMENFTGSRIGQQKQQHRTGQIDKRAASFRNQKAIGAKTSHSTGSFHEKSTIMKKIVSSASTKMSAATVTGAPATKNNKSASMGSSNINPQRRNRVNTVNLSDAAGRQHQRSNISKSSSLLSSSVDKDSPALTRNLSRDMEVEDVDDLDDTLKSSSVELQADEEDIIEGEGENEDEEEAEPSRGDNGEEEDNTLEVEGDMVLDENDENDYEMRDGELQIVSPSDDSIMNGLIEDDLSEIDRIDLVNKTISNTNQPGSNLTTPSPQLLGSAGSGATLRQQLSIKSNRSTPVESNQVAKRALSRSMRRVSLIASELKRDHPYLSNLNPDEQLSGKLSYIIKPGTTVIGKEDSCDIILHGLDIRANHAKIVYETLAPATKTDSATKVIYIEPILDMISEEDEEEEEEGQVEQKENRSNPQSAEAKEKPVLRRTLTQRQNSTKRSSNNKLATIFVNGVPANSRTDLHHCDRLLFGTNVYFVFVNNHEQAVVANNNVEGSGEDLQTFDSITYDLARAEVLKNIMMKDELNNSIVRNLIQSNIQGSVNDKENNLNLESSGQKLANRRGQDIGTNNNNSQSKDKTNNNESIPINEDTNDKVNYTDEYSERIRLDTAELAWQLNEVNKIAEEMDIRIQYELCVLTGAEQLIEPIEAPNWYDYGTINNDGMSNKFSHSSSQSSSKSSSIINGMMDSNRASSSVQSESQTNPIDGSGSVRTSNNTSGGPTIAATKTITDLNKVDASTIPAAVYVKVRSNDLDIDFYWSKDKFIDRRFKIQDLYGVYSFDNGGKQALISYLIEQSNHQLIIDPFFDDPRTTYFLIGHVQLILQPLSHLVDIDQEYDIISVDDEVTGTITIQAIPCHEENDRYYQFTSRELEDNILDDPTELIGRKLAFMLKINKCQQIPDKYTSVFCQYMLHLDSNVVRTDPVSNRQPDTGDIVYNHVHHITFEEISQETLDILRYGTMTIQVVGRYNYQEANSKPISTVFSIVNSINKHRAKLNQQQQQQHAGNLRQPASGSSLDHQLMMRGSGGPMSTTSKSGASSTALSAMMNMDNMDNQQGDDDVDEGSSQPQENIIDVILTKRKLDRAENQLHYLKRTVNIAEHYNKKHIPVKTVKKLLSSYGHDLDNGSFDELADVSLKKRSQNDSKTCTIS